MGRDAAWSLIAQRTREEAELYIETRRRGGFNLLMVNLLEHWFGDQTAFCSVTNYRFKLSSRDDNIGKAGKEDFPIDAIAENEAVEHWLFGD